MEDEKLVENSSTKKNDPDIIAVRKEMTKRIETAQRQREIIHARDQDVKLSKRLGDLVVPLIVIGIIVLIASFILIPYATKITENRKESSLLQAEILKKQAKVRTLEGISAKELEKNLRIVSTVVKDTMNVSALADEIDALSVKNNLIPSEESIANTNGRLVDYGESESLDWKPQYANSLAGPWGFKGSLEDICKFISDLRLKSSTVLSLGEVSISHHVNSGEDLDQEADIWTVQLSVKGYTVEPRTQAAIGDPVITKIEKNLLKEISIRSSLLNDANTANDGKEDAMDNVEE